MKKLVVNLLLLFIAAGGFNSCFAAGTPVKEPIVKQGVADLHNQDLFKNQVALNGDWCVYWDQLLMPGDPGNEKQAFVQYPSLWQHDSVEGHPRSSQGYATYSLFILLPKQRPELAIRIPDVYASYALYVNGKLLARNGQPGKSALEATPFWSTQVMRLASTSDTLSITMQVANFWHAKGGSYKEILIGKRDQLALDYQRDMAFDLVLTGCLFMGGLFFLGFYLFGKHDKTILFFSLFCIVYSYRLIGTDVYVLHNLFPALNWFVTIRLEYLSLCIGVALFAFYTAHLYPEDSKPILIKALGVACAAFCCLIIFTPPLIFTHFMIPFLFMMFGYTGYAFYVYVQAVRHKRSGSVYALLSTAVMMLLFLFINLNFFNVLPAFKAIVFICYIIFFFLQSLALSQRFARTFKQAAAEAQEGLRIKSEFLSTMSHEIRTPLNSVIGMTHILQTENPREDQKENLAVLYFSANNLLSIVNNILDYNKIEAGKIIFERIPFDIGSLCRNIIAGLQNTAAEKNIDLQLCVDEKLHKKIIGDPVRSSQVINNLVHNALKFTRQGWVRLSIDVIEEEEETVKLKISIEDTGIGISPEKQLIIFERFTQADSSTSRNFGGTGLGLTITKKLLELQDSRLKVNSKPGKGSVFYFIQKFALSMENTGTEKEDRQKLFMQKQALPGLSILLVEDNPLNIMVAQAILEKSGAEIEVAHNGQEALDIFNPLKHQLILMDLSMPVMDGYEATQQLRKRGETLPIIALTASTPREVESEATAAGITDIVVKPFNPEDLYRTILQYVQPVNS